jgi:hypothetical protein
MIANYAEKAKNMTAEGIKLLEGCIAELEMKKPRVGESGEDKDTGEEEQTTTA